MLPAVLFTFEALSVAVFAAKPVPATDTEVADVMPEPFTTTDMVLVVLGAVVPKSTVEPFVGDVNVGVVVDDDEVTVAERFTVMVLVPFWSVSLPVLLPADVPLKVTCTVPPVLLLTLEADRDVVFPENPVPETATEVALVSPAFHHDRHNLGLVYGERTEVNGGVICGRGDARCGCCGVVGDGNVVDDNAFSGCLREFYADVSGFVYRNIVFGE